MLDKASGRDTAGYFIPYRHCVKGNFPPAPIIHPETPL